MKYLKKFNESDKSEYYIEYVDGYYNQSEEIKKDIVNISEHSVNYFTKLFSHKNIKINKNQLNYGRLHLSIKDNTGNICNLVIIELKDEYYIVHPNQYSSSGDIKVPNVYKCDQMEGVKELLTDLDII